MKRNMSKITMVKKTREIIENWVDVILIYRNLKRKRFSTLKTREGLRIKMRNNSTDIQVFATVWLLEEYGKEGFLPEGNVVIVDIGAHVGFYALYVSQINRHAKIFSFEPVSENYNLLKENIAKNSLDNVKAFNLAVGGQIGEGRIFCFRDQSAHSIYKKSEKSEVVNCTTLDDIIKDNDIQKISVLKLDCEGAEYDILNKASDSSLEKIDRICMEYHGITDEHEELDALKNTLICKGFKIEEIPTSDNLGMIYAKR